MVGRLTDQLAAALTVNFFFRCRDEEAADILRRAAAVNNSPLAPFELDHETIVAESKRAEEVSVVDFFKKDQLPLMVPLW